jgi:hypothetical protein
MQLLVGSSLLVVAQTRLAVKFGVYRAFQAKTGTDKGQSIEQRPAYQTHELYSKYRDP